MAKKKSKHLDNAKRAAKSEKNGTNTKSENQVTKTSKKYKNLKKSRKSLRPILLLIFTAFSIELIGSILVGALPFFLIQVMGLEISESIMFIMENYLPFLGIFGVLVTYLFKYDKDTLKNVGHYTTGGKSGNTINALVWGILVGLATNGLCILIPLMTGDIVITSGNTSAWYLLFAFICIFIQSGTEELIYRGFVQKNLVDKYNITVAILVNSIYFGISHLLNPGITWVSLLNIILYGIVTSLIVYYYKSLWFCIGHHAAWNFTQNILFGLPNSGLKPVESLLSVKSAVDGWIYDVEFGVEGGVLMTGLGTLVILIILWCNHHKIVDDTRNNRNNPPEEIIGYRDFPVIDAHYEVCED